MHILLPDAVMQAIRQLNAAGYEAYIVGGCVRDTLLGRIPEDWDITTSATPDEMKTVFSDRRIIEAGIQHGTLIVVVDDMPLEITTYRVESGYSDSRHPDSVQFTRSLAEDLRRRDFTINAMAYHPENGLIDLYGGQMDLARKTIRCVGEPNVRFTEDALRILRALRFAAVLDFTIEAQTEVALRHLSPTIRRVSAERIMEEFCMMLRDNSVCRIFGRYKDVLIVVMPELVHVTDLSLLSLMPPMMYARFSALFWNTTVAISTIQEALRRLRLDKKTINTVGLLLSCREMPISSNYDLLRVLNRISPDLIWIYLTLRQADDDLKQRVESLLSSNACYKIPILAVDGDDVIAAGISAGPDVGRVLYALLDAVMEGKCPNQKDELIKWIAKVKDPVQ